MSSRDFPYWVEHFIGMVSLFFPVGVEKNKTWEKTQHLVNDKIDSQTTFVSKSLLVHIWYAFILSFFDLFILIQQAVKAENDLEFPPVRGTRIKICLYLI